jgi:hypothetical protein
MDDGKMFDFVCRFYASFVFVFVQSSGVNYIKVKNLFRENKVLLVIGRERDKV